MCPAGSTVRPKHKGFNPSCKLNPEGIENTICLQAWLAALHDFILCESDRHQANMVVQPDFTFRFIDNDHELNNRFGYGTQMLKAQDGSCMPNSVFLPHNLESWRVSNPQAVVVGVCRHTDQVTYAAPLGPALLMQGLVAPRQMLQTELQQVTSPTRLKHLIQGCVALHLQCRAQWHSVLSWLCCAVGQ